MIFGTPDYKPAKGRGGSANIFTSHSLRQSGKTLDGRTDGKFLEEVSTLENGQEAERGYSRKAAAAYLGIHINTLDRSDIPRVYFGRSVVFKREVLDRCFDVGFKIKGEAKCKK